MLWHDTFCFSQAFFTGESQQNTSTYFSEYQFEYNKILINDYYNICVFSAIILQNIEELFIILSEIY